MSRIRTIASVAASALLAFSLFARPAFADAHTEGTAKEALQKASTDYAATNYAGAAARLTKAVQACGANRCLPATKGALLRDLGTMQFRVGDKTGASKSWGDALALDQTLTLNPDYDASDVGAAYEDARASAGLPAGPVSSKPPPGAAGAAAAPAGGTTRAGATGAAGTPGGGTAAAPPPASEPTGEQPSGDFEHDPALEQRENTPLPVHVDYPGSGKLTRVVLKYKGAQMREWQRLELKKVEGNGYEGAIPCADVTRGTMRYWVQGFDKTGEPVAATGDPRHPYYVVIRDKITSEPPHLPGKEAPKSCEETDCPPGLPGCGKKKAGAEGGAAAEGAAGGEAAASGESAAGEEDKKNKGPKYTRLWVGVSGAIDYLPMPSAANVCKRNGDGTSQNSQGYYCYDSAAGTDFPNQTQNINLPSGSGSGTAKGQLNLGDIRVTIAVDYALTPNLLAGGRVGYVINAYPGKDSPHFPPLHVEARATYLFGDAPLLRGSIFAPMGFAGLGLSEFDGHQSTNIKFCTTAPCPSSNANTAQQSVDAWVTDAPFFVVIGAGARVQLARVALTAALRLNLAIGSIGLLPTFGPELGILYGF
jgi:hypothetical protein